MPDFDIVIIGGGLGGCAAALAATDFGCRVLVTEEYGWVGGQLTSQAVPPDEHQWIERIGRTRRYAELRRRIRDDCRRRYALTPEAESDPLLNPGQGWVSALCCEPKSALVALQEMLSPALTSGTLEVRTGWRPVGAEVHGDAVRSVEIEQITAGRRESVSAGFFLDATELGDLLPLAGAEFRTGAESRARSGELHAPEVDQPGDVQALTWCMAIELDPRAGADHTIDRPARYDFFRDYVPQLTPPWPGPLLSEWATNPFTLEPRRIPILAGAGGGLDLFTYRRIVSTAIQQPSAHGARDVSVVNWPQNDYLLTDVTALNYDQRAAAYAEAKQLSLSLLYWIQTEAPRDDGGCGYPEIGPAADVLGTPDGLAMAPYIRESRRIESMFTLSEAHVGEEMLAAEGRAGAAPFADSVGIGSYRIDLHPTTGGDNYIDIASRPFQIPLGTLIPIRLRNLLPACKNLGVTHIANGCTRLHPVEWNIGESAGTLAAWCHTRGRTPHEVVTHPTLLAAYQSTLVTHGIELDWAEGM